MSHRKAGVLRGLVESFLSWRFGVGSGYPGYYIRGLLSDFVGLELAEQRIGFVLAFSAQSFPLPMQLIVLWSLADTTVRVAIRCGKVETTHSQTPLATGSGSPDETPRGGTSLGLAQQSSAGEDESCRLANDSVLFPITPTVESRPTKHMRTKTASVETDSP